MSIAPFKTAIIGFGKIGAGYADDPAMARYYPYATHAQVLAEHPAFSWEAVVDFSGEALSLARERWRVPYAFKNIDELIDRYEPEVVVLATPPENRREILDRLLTVRAVIVEKPLGISVGESKKFIEYCTRQKLLVQVNLWRRADEVFRRLAENELARLVGQIQVVFGIYGNGLLNNGTHMVDFIRMLIGEIRAVQALNSKVSCYRAGPLKGDMNIPFNLYLHNGLVATFQPVKFEYYRENGLDIWGEKGRLAIMQEGLGIYFYPRSNNRAMQDEQEISSNVPEIIESTVGNALYLLYSNLAMSLLGETALWSSGQSALRSEDVINAIFDSFNSNGKIIELSS